MKSTVTYDAVSQAAAQLVSRQESPSIRTIRLTLGGGSFATIAKHLEAWRKNTQGGSAPARTPAWEISAEIRTVLAQEISRHVRQTVAGQEEALKKLAGDREDVLAENDRLERQIDTLTARIEEMRTEEIRREEHSRLLLAQLEEERKKAGMLTTQLHDAEKSIVRLEVRLETAEKTKGRKAAIPKTPSPSRKRSVPSTESPALTKSGKFMTLEHESSPDPDQKTLHGATEKTGRSRKKSGAEKGFKTTFLTPSFSPKNGGEKEGI